MGEEWWREVVRVVRVVEEKLLWWWRWFVMDEKVS
jgi:hypothetical protein